MTTLSQRRTVAGDFEPWATELTAEQVAGGALPAVVCVVLVGVQTSV